MGRETFSLCGASGGTYTFTYDNCRPLVTDPSAVMTLTFDSSRGTGFSF
jgi:hypothetical protein